MRILLNPTKEWAPIFNRSGAFNRNVALRQLFLVRSRPLILLIAISLSALHLGAQNKAQDVVGFWMTGEDNAKVQIYESNGKYYGKIVWINPNPKIAEDGHSHGNAVSHPKVGDVLLKDLIFDGGSEWEDGTIYDPYSQENYSCYVKFSSSSVLRVRGYTGVYIIGRTEYWTRTR